MMSITATLDIHQEPYALQQSVRRDHYSKRKIQPTRLQFSLFPLEARGECRHCVLRALRKKWEQISLNQPNCLWSCRAHIPHTKRGPVTQLPSESLQMWAGIYRMFCLALLFPKYQSVLDTRPYRNKLHKFHSLIWNMKVSIYPCVPRETRNSEKTFRAGQEPERQFREQRHLPTLAGPLGATIVLWPPRTSHDTCVPTHTHNKGKWKNCKGLWLEASALFWDRILPCSWTWNSRYSSGWLQYYSDPSCLSLLSAEPTGVSLHRQLIKSFMWNGVASKDVLSPLFYTSNNFYSTYYIQYNLNVPQMLSCMV